jgi:hypothetical protein
MGFLFSSQIKIQSLERKRFSSISQSKKIIHFMVHSNFLTEFENEIHLEFAFAHSIVQSIRTSLSVPTMHLKFSHEKKTFSKVQ